MELNAITGEIIRCSMLIHTELGPGLLESVYKECLAYELTQSGFFVEKEKSYPLIYKGVMMESGFRLDLLVNNRVVVEIKSQPNLAEVHFAQTLTYLKITNCQVGLLINFNVKHLKEGIRRIVHNYQEP